MTLLTKQSAMRERQKPRRGRPFGPRREFDFEDTRHKLRVFYLRSQGLSIARVASETGATPLWIAQWEEKGCPLKCSIS
jgi:hypothetical protein